MGLFDRFKRKIQPPIVWHVFREGNDVVADDGHGGTFRVPLTRAVSVRIVPMTGGNTHGGPAPGYQVAVRRSDGDLPIGKPTPDWRPARDLARQVCDVAELPLDELTERMFSQVGRFDVKADS